jgi:hypothetical protein
VESVVFGGPKATEKLRLGRPLRDYLVDVEVDAEDLDDVEEFLVVREGTPTPCNVKVDGENTIPTFCCINPTNDSPS